MRLLMLTQFYPPILGGIERHVQSLSTALAARGHQVAVATLWHPGQPQEEISVGVKIYRIRGTLQRFSSLFSTDRFHAPPFPDPELMQSLRRIIRKEQPDIVHAHNWIVHSFLPIKKWSKARLIMTLHDCEMSCVQMRLMYMDDELCSGPGLAKCTRCSIHHYGALKGPVTLVGNWVMNGPQRASVDMFLPVSSAVLEANNLNSGKTKHKVQVIPNFVPDDVAETPLVEDERLNSLPSEPFILQVGDLVKDKGIFVLLDAYKCMEFPPPLVLIGRRAADFPVHLPENVTLLESLPHNLVMQAWKRSLFGTVPSLCLDASPTVTIEAMASGRPVIGSSIGGIIDQVVEGETGFLVPPGDEDALCSAMQRLITDPALREQMGRAGLARVKKFQASTIVEQIERVYQSL